MGHKNNFKKIFFPKSVGGVCWVSGVECPDGQWQCETSKECISTSYLCDNTLDCDDESDENEIRCKVCY